CSASVDQRYFPPIRRTRSPHGPFHNHGLIDMKNACRAMAVVLVWAISQMPVLAQGGFTPQEALKRMKLPEGFQARLVASEADVRQPLSMTFDERGRLWVIQYIQYPTPAGLKAVAVDQFLRTKYDKV